MGDLRTVLIEGLFYRDTNGKINTDKGVDPVAQLEPFLDLDIQFAVHFLPSFPVDETKWGGGCCHWQPNPCPAGHHDHPDRLLNMAVRGVLGRNPDETFTIRTFDGKTIPVPLDMLDGHDARIAAATVFDVEVMRDALGDFTPENLEALGVRATNLRDLLAQLKKHTGGV